MAFIFADSFETITAGSDLDLRGWTRSGTPEVTSTQFKDGTQCIRLESSEIINWTQSAPYEETHGFLSVWFRYNTTPGASITIFDAVADNTTDQIRLRIGTNEKLFFTMQGTGRIGDDSDIVLSTDTWYHLELKWRFLDSVAVDDVECWVDGVLACNADAASDTLLTDNGVGGFRLRTSPNAGEYFYFDSPVFWDAAAGDEWNARRGMIHIETKAPDANGPDNDFVGSDSNSVDNYLHVDEINDLHDGDSSYSQSPSVGDKDSYNLPNMVETNLDSIIGVHLVTVAKKTGTNARGVKPFFVDGGSDFSGDENVLTNGTYTYDSHMFDENPDSAAPWTPADITTGNFGLLVT